VNCRKSSPRWRKSRCFAPDQLSVTFWPYDVGSDKKVTPGKECVPRDLTLISTCTLNSTERRQNLMRVYTGLQLIGRIALKNDSSEASLEASLC
jgi:hypothetical protein